MKKCPECDSENIINDARIIGSEGAEAVVAVDENPSALVFKKRSTSEITAKVCGDCGFIGFYAKYPSDLWSAYQNRGK